MAVALFDLDNTLIVGNSETSWFEYLAAEGYIDEVDYSDRLEVFGQQYTEGCLSIDEYIRFVLSTLTPHDGETLSRLRHHWLQQKIEGMIAKETRQLLKHHHDAGDELVIISASIDFCAEPIAALLEVQHTISTEAVRIESHFTGNFVSPACFANNKITLLDRWLEQSGLSLEGSYFYSDSYNDLPLLKKVDHPVVVDGDDKLKEYANRFNWKQMSLR